MSKTYELNLNQPFPLAYIDWCKYVKGIKKIKDTENRELVLEFYNTVWGKTGKDFTGLDFMIATGKFNKGE